MPFRNTKNFYVVRIHTRDKEARLEFSSNKTKDFPLDELPKKLRKIADDIETHFVKAES